MQCATNIILIMIFWHNTCWLFCADGLNQIKGLKVNVASVETNIVSTTSLDTLLSFWTMVCELGTPLTRLRLNDSQVQIRLILSLPLDTSFANVPKLTH